MSSAPPPPPSEGVTAAAPAAGRRLLLRGAAIGAAAFVVGFLFTALILFGGGGGDEVVTVPDLRGRTEGEARELVRRGELDMEVGSELTNPEVEAGRVLAQTPLPGEEVAPGSVVRVTLSSGAERRPVPDIRSLNGSQARDLLVRHGFAVEVEERIDDSPAGRILEVVPSPGTQIPLPGTIRLIVSAGPPRVAVPSVVGMTEAEAREVLASGGFFVDAVDHDPFAFDPPGTVIGQWPAGDAQVPAGTPVRLVVAGSDPGNL